MFKTILVCLFVGQIVASPYHRSKRAACATDTDCSGFGTCTGGVCKCDIGYSGDKCENQCFPADIVFVLDESGSVTEPNWKKQLEFTNELIDIFPIGMDKVRIGYLTYSSKVNKEGQLNQTKTKDEMKKKIKDLSYKGGGTNTPDAIFKAATSSFSRGNGDRIETPAVPNIMIIMTDGKTSSQYKPNFDFNAAFLRSKKDIEVFAIGISSGVDEKEIEDLASLPVSEHKFIVDNFNALNTIKEKILNSICKSTAAKADPCDKKPCHAAGTTKCVNGGNGAYTCECKLGYIGEKCETRCGVADIAWIIDSSGSIKPENYVKQMKFIHDFCDKLDISPTASQVAAVSFGLTARLDFDFKKYQDKASVLSAIDAIPHMKSYTNTSGGIRRTIEKVFTPAGGDRLDKPNIAIVITDGQSNTDASDTIPAAKLLHKHTAMGVSTFCIGVGLGNKNDEVKGIASDPDSEFLIEIKNYDEIEKYLSKILEGTCKTSDADHCASGPCKNAGTCQKTSNGYKCICVAGWTGKNCQTNIDDCKPNPCKNAGVCKDGLNSYTCTCASGWVGKNCDTPQDFCKPVDPCVQGTCSSQASGYKCTCSQGYTGKTCDTVIDYCKPTNPCVHGTCSSSTAGFKCTCNSGYTGTKCDVVVDNCKPTNPCKNGGACTTSGATFTCSCVNGYTGATCQTAPANNNCDKVDICFIIDSSASIGSNWGKQLDFIAGFGKNFQIGDKAKIGAVTFSSTAELSFPISGTGSANTNAEFETKIKAISHMKKGTYTHEGLGLAPDCGWRNIAGIKKLAIVVTDGKSINPTETASIAKSVRDNYQIEIHAVGISNADAAELNAIAGIGQTLAGKVYTAPDFSSLDNVSKDLAQGTCGTSDPCSPNPCLNGGQCTASGNTFTCACVNSYWGTTCNKDPGCKSSPCPNGNQCNNGNNGAYTCTSSQGCAKADILFVVDSSASVSLINWDLQVDFLVKLVNDFTIADDKTKVGVITFSSSAEISFPVSGANSPNSQQDFETKVKAITHMRKGTNTDVGLDLVKDAGVNWRPADPSIKRMVIVVTDGQSKDAAKTKTSADSLRQAGIQVHAIGIKNAVDSELNSIAGTGQANAGSIFKVNDFSALDSVVQTIKSDVCKTQDPCNPNPCQNSGSCAASGNSFTCTCTGGYTGNTCATAPNPCSFTPCKNGGQCTHSGNTFTCTCVNSYHGATCQNDPGCKSAPCQNGGQCANGNNGAYTCTCTGGYTGNNCQTPPVSNPCSPSPCLNGGQCTASGNTFTCACVNGYWGTTCNKDPGCNSSPCLNGGQCTNGNNGAFTCACVNNYWGTTCNKDPGCKSSPCLNGGQCTNGNSGAFTCACVNGYWGTTCNKDPGCKSAPCQNGGQCANGNNGAYTCTCTGGYTGNNCQTAPRNENGCGVCTGAGCVTAAMDADAVYNSGGSIKDCPACYTKKNKDGSFERGCVSDIPAAWTTALQASTSNIPEAGGSVCYPMNEDGGSEVCMCKGNNCNMKSFSGIGGGNAYTTDEITCTCPGSNCPGNPSAPNPYKCYKDGFLPKCDCQNCDCLSSKRRKRWISWLW